MLPGKAAAEAQPLLHDAAHALTASCTQHGTSMALCSHASLPAWRPSRSPQGCLVCAGWSE